MAEQLGDRDSGRYEKRDEDAAQESPYGPGFVAAALVMAAVLLCGALLIVTGLGGGVPASRTSVPPAGSDPALPTADPSDPAVPRADATRPATPGTGSTPTATPGSTSSVAAGGCAVPDGDQGIPAAALTGVRWEVHRRMVVPASSTLGPGRTDPDGFRRCFAHSPAGAVLAAYNAVAAFAADATAAVTARKLLLPGPDTDRTLRELAAEASTGGGDDEPSQIAGFRVIDASRDRVTVALALRVPPEHVSATLTLVWHGSDWRLVPPRAGQALGAPFTSVSSMSGFVAWSGL